MRRVQNATQESFQLSQARLKMCAPATLVRLEQTVRLYVLCARLVPTKYWLEMPCVQAAKLGHISLPLGPPQICARATLAGAGLMAGCVMNAWPGNTKLAAAAGRAPHAQRVHIPPKSGLCRQYALIALLVRIQSARPATASRVVWPAKLASPQKDKMRAHNNPIVSSAPLGPTL